MPQTLWNLGAPFRVVICEAAQEGLPEEEKP